jgi:hypothetical protein
MSLKHIIGTGLVTAAFAFNASAHEIGQPEVTAIPPEMEDLGFELVPSNCTHVLIVPSFEIPYYTPDESDFPGVGYFTKIDLKQNLVRIKTSEGEVATISIDLANDSLTLINRTRGNEPKTTKSTYEPDEVVRDWVNDHYYFAKPLSVQYDQQTGDLTVYEKDGEEIYSERLDGVSIEVLADRFLKMEVEGKRFYAPCGRCYDEKANADYVLVRPFFLQDGPLVFNYTIGSVERDSLSLSHVLRFAKEGK